jgi:hypothetical protein
MRSAIVLAALLTVATSACGDETGILVHTTASAELTVPITELRYYVGANVLDDPQLRIDEEPEKVVLDGHDIHEDPHLLMIRPDAEAAKEALYAVAVVAYSGTDKVGIGFLDKPVGFVPGSVTPWNIVIDSMDRDASVNLPDDCVRWVADDGAVSIGSLADKDCDGYRGDTDDCDDANAALNPGMEEAPDGKDNNCDGVCDGEETDGSNILDSDEDGFTSFGRYGVCSESIGPNDCNTSRPGQFPGAWDFCDSIDDDCDGMQAEYEPCFTQNGGGKCVQGVRTCPSSSVPNTDCSALPVPDGTPSLQFACNAYNECADAVATADDPMGCLLGEFRGRSEYAIECSTFHSGNGTCDGGALEIILPANDAVAGDNCSYQIIGPSQQQGYVVSLVPTDGGDSGTIVNECHVTLKVDTTDAGAGATLLMTYALNTRPPQVIRISLSNDLFVGECVDAPGLECGLWAYSVPLPPGP